MIQITLKRKALNANARSTKNEFQNFEFHFKALLQKKVNAKRSNFPPFRTIDHLLHSFPRIHIASLNGTLALRVSEFTHDKLQLCQHALSSQIH
ncbi:hypothetical protein T01_6931 [Trichinella spiralis]|uniref:Uncharacterized protein n=1 Tax=Trichinella spiralis TaxID=6334 RepID=A0A0V1B1M4_TRISP|nr:hypothetical protein T01_6931 [Trichinella spiralis]